MGAAYFIIPDETGRELFSPTLALIQLAGLVIVGVIALAGFHVNWWEGRKFLEIPRPLDYLVVVDVLLFIVNIGMTLLRSQRRTTTSLILFFGLFSAALLYLPGMIETTNQTMDSYWRWWVVHLWVEGVWELIMGGILSYLLIKLTGVDREVIEKWLYVIVGLTFLSGILGTGHHYYFIGTPRYWLWIGGIFSALEPLAFLGMAMYAIAMVKRGGRQHPNTVALHWTVGCAVMSAVGAGFLGFAHTLPQVNLYTHGTLVTAMHGHLAFWGAYAMIVLGIISYCLPLLTGRKLYDTGAAAFAFWTSNIGMVSMTGAFAVAGVTQVYLERRVGMDFLAVQNELAIHFFGLTLAAGLTRRNDPVNGTANRNALATAQTPRAMNNQSGNDSIRAPNSRPGRRTAPRPEANFSTTRASIPASADGSARSRRVNARPTRAGSPARMNSSASASSDPAPAIAPAHFMAANATGLAAPRSRPNPNT